MGIQLGENAIQRAACWKNHTESALHSTATLPTVDVVQLHQYEELLQKASAGLVSAEVSKLLVRKVYGKDIMKLGKMLKIMFCVVRQNWNCEKKKINEHL
jgi:hypothetical protein